MSMEDSEDFKPDPFFLTNPKDGSPMEVKPKDNDPITYEFDMDGME